ncbi:MAG: hypothetical protein KI789_13780, partial [Hoeflea sp.]|nr:hypothetical protein [Hoeflea sp.]
VNVVIRGGKTSVRGLVRHVGDVGDSLLLAPWDMTPLRSRTAKSNLSPTFHNSGLPFRTDLARIAARPDAAGNPHPHGHGESTTFFDRFHPLWRNRQQRGY